MSEEERQAGIRATMEAIRVRIREAEERGAEDAQYYARRGEYVTAVAIRRRVREDTRPMRDELLDLRRMLPPFVTEKDGILFMHPVTPENRHLLWD